MLICFDSSKKLTLLNILKTLTGFGGHLAACNEERFSTKIFQAKDAIIISYAQYEI